MKRFHYFKRVKPKPDRPIPCASKMRIVNGSAYLKAAGLAEPYQEYTFFPQGENMSEDFSQLAKEIMAELLQSFEIITAVAYRNRGRSRRVEDNFPQRYNQFLQAHNIAEPAFLMGWKRSSC